MTSPVTHTNKVLITAIVFATAILLVVVGCDGEQSDQSVENTVFKTDIIVSKDVTPIPTVATSMDDLKAKATPFTEGESPLPTELTAFKEELVSSELDIDILNNPYYTFKIDLPSEPKDEVVLDSLSIRNCVARGLVHNLSDSQYATNVVVTLQSKDGYHTASWNWPLTMMPGEYAPYEIELTWDTTYLDPEYVNAFDSRSGERSRLREPKGNVHGSVNADFVGVADISRAFARNFDRSVDFHIGGVNPHLIVYDERLFSLEQWDEYFTNARGTSLISKDSFEYIFPTNLVLDNDIDAVASKFIPLESSDLYYVPETVFPNIYDDDMHHAINDVKIYQAIIAYGDVLDVRELIPFRLQNEENSASMIGQILPHNDFKAATSKAVDSSYIVLLIPLIYPEVVDGVRTFSNEYSPPYDDYVGYVNSKGPIWVGKSNLSSREENDRTAETKVSNVLLESPQWTGNSCDRGGGLTREKYRVVSPARIEVIDHTLGYYGFFGKLESSQESSDSVEVVMDTVSAEDGFVRGLIYNLSSELFARDIVVKAKTIDRPEASEQWHWPLTLQPGERAPFEIFLGGWKGSIPISQLSIEVMGKFSQQVDISRSFLINGYNQGTVHTDDSTAQLGTHMQFSEEYRHFDITVDGAFKSPHQHISLRTYLDRYSGVLCLEQTQYEDLSDGCTVTFESSDGEPEKPPFNFVELYAEVEIPDSHPSLGSQIAFHATDTLLAYVAMLDDNGKVLDVKKLVPFTSSYSQEAKKEMFWKIDSTSAPNLTGPNSLRLLFSLPYSEERRWDLRNLYQVWIGGSQESSG